jgi:hypothetical protein
MKYGNKRCEHDGQGFRSQLERDVYATLKLMERAGEIRDIRREQSVQLTPSIKHKIDFIVFDLKSNQDIGIEAKGAVDRDWSLKRRLYQDFGPFEVQVWKQMNRRVGCAEVIKPGKYKWGEKHV